MRMPISLTFSGCWMKHIFTCMDENPQELYQCPLHSTKVTVWCAISSHGVIGPYSFEKRGGHCNNSHPVAMLLCWKIIFVHSLQNFAHLNVDSYWFNRAEQMLIPLNAQLQLLDDCLKGASFHAIVKFHGLWNRIEEEIAGIPLIVLHRVMQNFHHKLGRCVQRNGQRLYIVLLRPKMN
ncbi:hypothetical protein PR048_021569, partial [Dryococelus australis]